MDLTPVLDTAWWNTFWAVVIGVEVVFVLALRLTRSRSSSRNQALVGMMALATFGILGIVTALGQEIQTVSGDLLPIGSFIPSVALLLRVAIFVFATTFIWHEWKENGVHGREPGGDR